MGHPLIVRRQLFTGRTKIMVFNAIFNNFPVILWQSVLLVKESGENHRKKKYKRTNNNLQNTTQKSKDGAT
jgi:hypothetical protein